MASGSWISEGTFYLPLNQESLASGNAQTSIHLRPKVIDNFAPSECLGVHSTIEMNHTVDSSKLTENLYTDRDKRPVDHCLARPKVSKPIAPYGRLSLDGGVHFQIFFLRGVFV